MQAPQALYGRDDELDRVAHTVDACRGGTSRLVVVRGDAGVGKSALLDAVVQRAERRGLRVLVGQAHEAERHIPFAGYRHALLDAVRDESSERLRRTADELAAALRLAAHRDAVVDRAGAAELCLQMLVEWAERSPVLLVLDDLHAADPDTLSLLVFLARHLRHHRVAIVVAARTSAADVDDETAAALARLAEAADETLVIGPLDGDHVDRLVADRLRRPPSTTLCAAIRHSTAGNAYFVVELVRTLADGGQLCETEDGVGLVDEHVVLPSTSRTLVLERVHQQGDAAFAVAQAAALLQDLTTDRLTLLTDATGLHQDDVAVAFDALVRAGVLVERDGQLWFSHPIVANTLADDLGLTRRRRVHGRIAAALLARHGTGGDAVTTVEIAHHVSNSAEPGDERAVAALVAAGDAIRTLAPIGAIGWYTRALALLAHAGEGRGEALIKLARANATAGRMDEAAALCHEALGLVTETRSRVDAIATLAMARGRAGHPAEGLAALDELVDVPDAARPMLFALRMRLLIWEERMDEVGRALATVDDDPAIADAPNVQMLRVQYLLAAGRHGEAQAAEADLMARAAALPQRQRISLVSFLAAMACYHHRPARADVLLAELAVLDPRAASPLSAGPNLAVALVVRDVDTGRWDAALDRVDQLLPELDERGDQVHAAVARGHRALLTAERGTLTAGERAALEASLVYRSLTHVALATDDLATGDPRSARRRLHEAIDLERSSGRASQAPRAWETLVELELAAGDVLAARRALAELRAVDDGLGLLTAHLGRLRAEALVEGDVTAGREAVALATEWQLEFERAKALYACGCAAKDGDALLEAHALFAALGALRRQQDCVSELRRLGRRPRRRNGAGLSDSERRILALVAEGLTNRQISDRVHLSPKTVEMYLSRLYARTGCTNRTDLALAVADGRVS